MAAGVFRPYTLIDILGSLNDNNQQESTVVAQGYFAEADEGTTVHDTMATTVQPSPAWDAGVWGQFTWA
jgi:hypothetical protein